MASLQIRSRGHLGPASKKFAKLLLREGAKTRNPVPNAERGVHFHDMVARLDEGSD